MLVELDVYHLPFEQRMFVKPWDLLKNNRINFIRETRVSRHTFSTIPLNFVFDRCVDHLDHKQILVDQDTINEISYYLVAEKIVPIPFLSAQLH